MRRLSDGRRPKGKKQSKLSLLNKQATCKLTAHRHRYICVLCESVLERSLVIQRLVEHPSHGAILLMPRQHLFVDDHVIVV